MSLPQTGDPDLNRASEPSAGDHVSPPPGPHPSTSYDSTVSAASQAHVRFPPFWAHDPVLWFVQVDINFSFRRITSDTSRYEYVVESLPSSAAAEVRDILLSPPPRKHTHTPSDAYTALKDALITRLMTSEQRRIEQLLSCDDLGYRKPTQLLRHLQYRLGDKAATIDSAVLREIFLHRLSSNVRVALAAARSLPLNGFPELADSVVDIAPPLVAALPAPVDTVTTDVGLLSQEVSKLTELVAHLMDQTRPARRSRSPRPSVWRPQRSPSPPRRYPSPVNPALCWYHQRFGHRARRCEHPCTWTSANETTNH
ncbi:uncharacterized protein LOC135375112 [Ornithodoros turicata]|uniref:uncharacterized protein LOC135375112 n=1 Tax=Ornithodoros turicata TaxID=34597 RepID=UPI00313A48C5